MKRIFLYLAVITVIALLVLVLAPEYDTPGRTASDTLLLPDVAGHINDVDRVEIVTPGNSVLASMFKGDAGWQLQQMGGYHADWGKLQSLLAAVAQARIVATKTDRPEYYARLGVEDVSQESANSILLRISIGEQTSGILIGNQAQGTKGQYVRLQDQAASVQIDRTLEVTTELLDWVDSGIIDINASEVAEVEIIHPLGERILVTRISADQTDFDLVDLPVEREIKSSWAVNSLGSVLSLLDMESVKAAGTYNWDEAVKMRLLMFSGVEIIADLVVAEDHHLLRLRADHPAADVVDKQSSPNDVSDAQRDIEARAEKDIAARVASINQKTEGWVYVINEQKYDAMAALPEDLLKPMDTP